MTDTAVQEKKRAALGSVAAAVVLTTIKLAAGLATGSLGLLAEAAHSALDLAAATVTWFAVRLSDQPADRGHHYGHGKVENLSALVETLLLLATCAWIVLEAIERLRFAHVEVRPTIWAFAVVAVSIVVDVNRSRMLRRAARKHNSQALEADALHFATDVWSSVVVLVGLALVALAGRLGPSWAWLARADAIAALGVAAIVIAVSVRLGLRAVAALLDAAPPGLRERIQAEVLRVDGIQGVVGARVRASGAAVFVDLTVAVDRTASLEEGHRLATEAQDAVERIVPRADVIVHVDPVRPLDESLPDTVNAIATQLGVHAHSLSLRRVHDRSVLELHVEVPAHLSLRDGHALVSRFEQAIHAEVPGLTTIATHIEPLTRPVVALQRLDAAAEAQLRQRIAAIVATVSDVRDCSECRVRLAHGGYEVILTCHADPDLSIEAAHHLAHEIESHIRMLVMDVSRVLVHLEPDGLEPDEEKERT